MDQQPQPQPLADRIAEALRTAARDCDGTCGLTETACFEQHPIQVSVIHFDQVAGVYGYVTTLADVAAAVVEPELAALRAERDELAAELGARDDKARKRGDLWKAKAQQLEQHRDRLLADIAVLIRELADRDDKLTQARATGRRLNYRAQHAESQVTRLTRTAPAARPAD